MQINPFQLDLHQVLIKVIGSFVGLGIGFGLRKAGVIKTDILSIIVAIVITIIVAIAGSIVAMYVMLD